MGLLVEGQWLDQWYDTKSHNGEFVRQTSQFRNWITADGSAGPTGDAGFEAAPGRYHLYVSLACPWAHRSLIFRQLKQLESLVTVSIVEPLMLENGWQFAQPGQHADQRRQDHLYSSQFLHQIYTRAEPKFSGRVTVPVLWDKQRETIVNNESADIIRMFNSAFDHITGNHNDYYPEQLRETIDTLNTWIYESVNNGVYRAGFATTQTAYAQAFTKLFDALDTLDTQLGQHRYLTGNSVTEADWRLFTTLIRFDAVYFGHFKCNKQRIADYPNLSAYVRDLFQHEDIASTVNLEHIKTHYYGSHRTINPTGIIPIGPDLDFSAPHHRADGYGFNTLQS